MALIIEKRIIIDGNEVGFFHNVSLQQDLHWHHRFELLLPINYLLGVLGKSSNDSDPIESKFNSCKECIGKKFSLEMNLIDAQNANGQTFNGIITNLSIARGFGKQNDIKVSGYSPTILLNNGNSTRSFSDFSLGDIFTNVCGDYDTSLLGSGKNLNEDPVLEYVVQYDESDFNFLSRLADRYNQWLYYDGQNLILGTPDKDATIELFLGDVLLDFNLSMNLQALQFKEIRYDYQTSTLYEAENSGKSVNGLGDWGDFALNESDGLFNTEPINLFNGFADKKEVVEDYVKNRRAQLANNLVTVTGTSKHADIRVGSVIEIKGSTSTHQTLGDESMGKYFVIKVSHYLNHQGDYENNFVAIPADVKFPPVNKHFKPVYAENQIARVVENTSDPEKQGRIKVEFGWQRNTGNNSPWLRLMTPHSGEQFGFYFIPELYEDVMVAFENGDPDRPYVIGSFYRKTRLNDEMADPKNYKKTIRTVSGNELTFNDESGKETISIFNPDNKNEIILTMDGKKIRIKTVGLLEMVAENIDMTASKNMTVTVGENLSMSVGKDMDLTVADNQSVDVGKAASHSTGKDLDVSVGGKHSMTVSKSSSISTTQDCSISSNGAFSVSATKDATIEANMKAKFSGKAGVVVESLATAEISSKAGTTVKGDAMVNVDGGLVNVNGKGPVAVKGALITLN